MEGGYERKSSEAVWCIGSSWASEKHIHRTHTPFMLVQELRILNLHLANITLHSLDFSPRLETDTSHYEVKVTLVVDDG